MLLISSAEEKLLDPMGLLLFVNGTVLTFYEMCLWKKIS